MPLFVELLIYLLIGATAGFLSGLLGVGGGMIVVPSLLIMFHYLGFSPDIIIKMAIGTSLAAMIFTAGSAALAHRKGVIWPLFKTLVPGVLIGTVLGAWAASVLPARYLQTIFGCFVALFGLYFLFTARTKEIEGNLHPHYFLMSLIGLFIGSISALLGLGGGLITVPLLTIFGTSMRHAISTSVQIGFLIAIGSVLSFFYFGLEIENSYSLGYIYIPAFLAIGLTAACMAPIGAKLAYTTSSVVLKSIFGLFQIVVGIFLIY